MNLSQALRGAMDKRKMNQPALARASGVTQPTISEILSGIIRHPEARTMARLAVGLGYSKGYFMQFVDEDAKEAVA